MSMSASGKIADAIVFFGWKGIASVRQWLKPANPQSAGQGDIRVIIGGLGRAIGRLVATAPFVTKLVALGAIPSQQTHQSYLVQYIKDTYIGGAGTTMTGNYASILAELTGHTAVADFRTAANTLGIAEFDLAYASVAAFDKGLGVYLMAKAAIALGFTGSPYTKTLANWTTTQINKLVNHIS